MRNKEIIALAFVMLLYLVAIGCCLTGEKFQMILWMKIEILEDNNRQHLHHDDGCVIHMEFHVEPESTVR